MLRVTVIVLNKKRHGKWISRSNSSNFICLLSLPFSYKSLHGHYSGLYYLNIVYNILEFYNDLCKSRTHIRIFIPTLSNQFGQSWVHAGRNVQAQSLKEGNECVLRNKEVQFNKNLPTNAMDYRNQFQNADCYVLHGHVGFIVIQKWQ